jgi:two-component system chemotaxis response regulator CheB
MELIVVIAASAEPFTSGHIYVAPPDHHLLLEPSGMRLSRGPKVNHTLPAADPLFTLAAAAFGKPLIGVVLSGGGGDGDIGLKAIKAHDGLVLMERPEDATTPSMPLAAIEADHPDACFSISELARRVAFYCSRDGNNLSAVAD